MKTELKEGRTCRRWRERFREPIESHFYGEQRSKLVSTNFISPRLSSSSQFVIESLPASALVWKADHRRESEAEAAAVGIFVGLMFLISV